MTLLVLSLLSGCPEPAPFGVPTAKACPTYWYDEDGDGFAGSNARSEVTCDRPSEGFVPIRNDCDPQDASIFPGAPETCDNIDGDCDDRIDEGVGSCPYRDLSGADHILRGEAGADRLGSDSSTAGDVDGDGLEDLLFGAWNDSEGVMSAGAAYLVRAADLGSGRVADVAALEVRGSEVEENLGVDVAGGYDANGDGVPDLLVGADQLDGTGTDSGGAYLISGALEGTYSAGDAARAVFLGAGAGDEAGHAVAMGDLLGWPWADLVVSGHRSDAAGRDAGMVGIFRDVIVGTWILDDAQAVFFGEAEGDHTGHDLAVVGDTDGDGLEDLVIGASGSDRNGSNAGVAWLVTGRHLGTWSIAWVASAALVGDASGYEAGEFVAGAGDVDGDGYDDLLVGTSANVAYLVRGPVAGEATLSSVAEATVSAELGSSSTGFSHEPLAGAGDVDGDGFGDVLVGSYVGDSAERHAGQTWLFYGPVSGSLGVTEAGSIFYGESESAFSGSAVAGLGDVDGDGLGDFTIGAWQAWDGRLYSGAAYVLLGSSF